MSVGRWSLCKLQQCVAPTLHLADSSFISRAFAVGRRPTHSTLIEGDERHARLSGKEYGTDYTVFVNGVEVISRGFGTHFCDSWVFFIITIGLKLSKNEFLLWRAIKVRIFG